MSNLFSLNLPKGDRLGGGQPKVTEIREWELDFKLKYNPTGFKVS